MKKLGVIVLLSLFVFGFIGSFVSAQASIQQFIDDFAKGAEPIAKVFVGGVDGSDLGGLTAGEALFAKVLVFFIVLTIVSLAVRTVPRIGEHRGISFIIALLITMLGVRYITSGALLNAIWLPSGTLSVVLATFLPFIIFFFFMQGFESSMVRKVGWVSFVVIFFGLAYMRWDVFAATAGASKFNLAWMYVVIAGLSLIMLVFDKQFHAMMTIQGLMKIKDAHKRGKLIELTNKEHELIDSLSEPANVTNDANLKRIREEIKANQKAKRELLKA